LLVGDDFGTPGFVSINGATENITFSWLDIYTFSFTTPSRQTPIDVPVIAVIGQQSSMETILFSYHDFYSVSPLWFPTRGASPITIKGVNFVDSATYVRQLRFTRAGNMIGNSDNSEYVDSNTLIWSTPALAAGFVNVSSSLNEQNFIGITGKIQYYDEPMITGVWPRSGPTSGGTIVYVSGVFPNTGVVLATIGGVVNVTCNRINGTLLKCVTQQYDTTGYIGLFSISVDLWAGDMFWTSDAFNFQYYQTPVLIACDPPLGVITGGNIITVTMVGLIQPVWNDGMILRFGEVNGVGALLTSTCSVNLALGALSCVAPELPSGVRELSIALNGQQFTDDTGVTYQHYPHPSLFSLSSTFGAIRGGLVVQINGTGFISSGTTNLIYVSVQRASDNVVLSTNTVQATFISSTKLQFSTPTVLSNTGAVVLKVTLNADQYTLTSLPFTYYGI
jgi:hypothetical protein